MKVAIIGAGIIGLQVANEHIKRHPEDQIYLLEKNKAVALEQTSHNSNVVHSGVFVKEGTLKAELIEQSKLWIEEYCKKHHIFYKRTPKQIKTNNLQEYERLAAICDDSCLPRLKPQENGLTVTQTAITDYKAISKQLAKDFITAGGQLLLNVEVNKVEYLLTDGGRPVVRLTFKDKRVQVFDYIYICAGTYSDYVSQLFKLPRANEWNIIPFTGKYYWIHLPGDSPYRKRLLYPVPDPRSVFLGVHLTCDKNGAVTAGPTAGLGLSRTPNKRVEWRAVKELVSHPVMLARCILPYTGQAVLEQASQSCKWIYKQRVKHLLKGTTQRNKVKLERCSKFGVRAQVVTRTGELVEDFLWDRRGPVLQLVNAPSPGATCSYGIAVKMCDQMEHVRELNNLKTSQE